MVVTYYVKLFRTEADRHNGILISLILKVEEKIKRHDHGKVSLTTSPLIKNFKDLGISIVENSNIVAFCLNSGGLQLNDKGLGRLAINLKLKIRKL